MRTNSRLPSFAVVVALLALISGPVSAQQQSDAAAIKIGAKDIGGVVSSPHGREAGVWVIAETTELPTRFARIVVTDDRGRYLVPDLPQADYQIWVRGYGLVDSPKMRAKPGQRLDLGAAPAPNDADAAHFYPAIFWYSLLPIPDKSQFGGENGIPANVTQQDWLTIIKNRACVGCHQLGQESTRTIPAAFSDEKTSADAWMRRVQSGQSGPFMVTPLAGQLGGAPFKYFAEWTDQIAAGELPREKPPRPQGVEHNLVITEWDWGRRDKYLYDLISTDKRQPTVNAHG
ncbi:MAG: carboxypeptidase regulatory-like domain-containing protein, partial [Alphaproteobacteria bacterium]|nr:carboxypeptidase regulatory-like domain-containing protein [Alphaproteobacteria bacterium]